MTNPRITALADDLGLVAIQVSHRCQVAVTISGDIQDSSPRWLRAVALRAAQETDNSHFGVHVDRFDSRSVVVTINIH